MPRKITAIRIQIKTVKWLILLNVFGPNNSLRVSIVSILFVL